MNKTVIFLLVLSLFAFKSQASDENITLYPVYSQNLDTINRYFTDLLHVNIHRIKFKCVIRLDGPSIYHPCSYAHIDVNLNNLLKFQDEYYNQLDSFKYHLLGRIIINEQDNKISYDFFKFDDWHINNKILTIKKNIAYINDNNFTFEEVKELLDADLLGASIAKELYQNKTIKLSTKLTTNHLINCRFCNQFIDFAYHNQSTYYLHTGYKFILDDILFNGKNIEQYQNYKRKKNIFADIKLKGGIYQQLDNKHIQISTNHNFGGESLEKENVIEK